MFERGKRRATLKETDRGVRCGTESVASFHVFPSTVSFSIESTFEIPLRSLFARIDDQRRENEEEKKVRRRNRGEDVAFDCCAMRLDDVDVEECDDREELVVP